MISPSFPHDQRSVQRDQIGFLQQFIFFHVGQQSFLDQFLIRIGIPADHGHSVTLGDPGEAFTDLSCSHDTADLVVEVDTEQTR